MKGFDNHAYKAYEFSHFLPTSYPKSLLTHANNTRKIWHERFSHVNFKYLQKIPNNLIGWGFPLVKSLEGVCPVCLVVKHPEKKKWGCEGNKSCLYTSSNTQRCLNTNAYNFNEWIQILSDIHLWLFKVLLDILYEAKFWGIQEFQSI